jgi:hypothetical protein
MQISAAPTRRSKHFRTVGPAEAAVRKPLPAHQPDAVPQPRVARPTCSISATPRKGREFFPSPPPVRARSPTTPQPQRATSRNRAPSRQSPDQGKRQKAVADAAEPSHRTQGGPPRQRAAGLTWSFTWWQVQGSNLRRLSRRFYRGHPPSVGNGLSPAVSCFSARRRLSLSHSSTTNSRNQPDRVGRYWTTSAGQQPAVCRATLDPP